MNTSQNSHRPAQLANWYVMHATQAPVTLKVPQFFHDILDERTRLSELALIAITTAIIFTAAWFAGLNQLLFTAGFRWIHLLAIGLIVDIIAGAVANLTEGTNDYYRLRPLNRLIFIAIHIQPVVLHAILFPDQALTAFNPEVGYAVIIWLYTMLVSLWVNHYNRDERSSKASSAMQRPLAGALMLVGIAYIMTAPATVPVGLKLVYILYLYKVAYSFAVDHAPYAERTSTCSRGVGQHACPLTTNDLNELTTAVIAPAFDKDPLFISLREMGWAKTAMPRLLMLKATTLDETLVIARDTQGETLGIASLEVRKQRFPYTAKYLKPRFLVAITWHLIGTRIQMDALGFLNQYMKTTEYGRPKVPHGYVSFIAVKPEFQGKGVGKALLLALENHAVSLNLQTIALDTENQQNVSFYESIGFVRSEQYALNGCQIYTLQKSL